MRSRVRLCKWSNTPREHFIEIHLTSCGHDPGLSLGNIEEIYSYFDFFHDFCFVLDFSNDMKYECDVSKDNHEENASMNTTHFIHYHRCTI